MYKITQLSIFLENKMGKLYHVLDLLAQNDINIRALFLADTTEFGILRLVVQDPIKAKEILESNDYIVKNTPIIGAELDDTPGGLSSILKILKDEGIDLEYLYAFTHEKSEKAILLLQSKDLDELVSILNAYKIPLVPAEEVYNLILKFANYGFNKAHSVSYAIIGYKIAYLKVHYPLYFENEILNNYIGLPLKTKNAINECKRLGVEIVNPMINLSDCKYVIKEDKLIYPLSLIKGIGTITARSIEPTIKAKITIIIGSIKLFNWFIIFLCITW